ncbi:shikimate kinase [Tenacibaculum sp. S7007]|uniref:Shikimate kinase n=1 Tax=Tenacibaculum pelagium TaxID=2759527 RepID=A0A839AJ36_9FLAO|nr:shikimate kinase [Tenacibaculum pelagium]MBA6155113.1 shikimate kinase [Tenacibaculum pelagium]
MKIVLVGYMASGKSTIGRLLAKKMELRFIDLDDYIEKKEGKSISDIFKINGEIYFRKKEHFYLKELLNLEDDFILALGGGTPCYAGNMHLINENKSVRSIYLRLKIPTLVDRLINEKSKRPLVAELKNTDIPEYIAKHLFERSFYYNQSVIIVGSDNKTVEETITEIYELLC